MPANLASLKDHPHWDALRSCWFQLKNIEAPQPSGVIPGLPELRQRHADAVKALVAEGELESAVAEAMSVAFEEIVAHVDGMTAMCYFAFPAAYFPRMDLTAQIAILDELASIGDIDAATIAWVHASLEFDPWKPPPRAGESPAEPEAAEPPLPPSEAIAQVQASLARNIAWLRQLQAGESSDGSETAEPNSAASEAARILAELLLGDVSVKE